jgi:hypothetical protein
MREDWFSAFAEKRYTTSSKYRATWATWATNPLEPQNTAVSGVAQSVAQAVTPGATWATNIDPVAHVAHLLPKGSNVRATPETAENCGFHRPFAHVAHLLPKGSNVRATPETAENCGFHRPVAHVAHDLDKENSEARSANIETRTNLFACVICGRAAKVADTWIHCIENGRDGRLHLRC